MSSPLTQFQGLDDLVQTIYSGSQRFVLLSHVSEDEWVLNLGHHGSEGRWWRGSWKEADILTLSGSKASSDKLLDIAEKFAKSIIGGDVVLCGWTRDEASELELNLTPSDKPTNFHLTEISAEDAASYATQVLFRIATEAQTRKCQLLPTFVANLHDTYVPTVPTSSKSLVNESGSSNKKRVESRSQRAAEQPAPSKKRKERKEDTSDPEEEPKPKPKPKAAVVKPLKNIPKKATRKFQPVQFEDD